MSSAGAVRAGRAYVEMGVDGTSLDAGLKRAQARVRAFGASIQSVGANLFKGGVGAAVPFAASTKIFADFEQSMARVHAITNASGDEFKALGERAKQLGRDTVFSSTEAAQAMGVFAQAGFKVNEIMTATGPALDLAAAAQIGIAEAADISVKVLKGMGMSAKDLAGAVDVMAKAVTTSNTNMTQLGDAFKFVGPIAKTAGVSFEEITAAIQLLSDAGIQGEMAGTTLRGVILTLAAPSEKAAETLQQLGVHTKDARGKFLGLAPIIAQLENSLQGLGSGEKLEKLASIFPDRQAAGAAELVAQGADKLATKTKSLGGQGGTAAKIAAIQLDTLKGSAEQVMSSLEGVAIALGEALAPTLRSIGSFLVDVTNGMAKFVKENSELFVTVAKGVAVVIAIGASMFALGLALKAAAFAMGLLRAAIVVTTVVVNTINAVFRVLTISINLASAASTTFAALSAIFAALTSPVGLIVIGLAALALWLYKSGQGAKLLKELGGAFESLKATAIEAFGGISNAIKAGDIGLAAKILWAALKLEFIKGLNYLKGIWADWGVAALDVFTNVKFKLASWIVDITADFSKGWISITGSLNDAFVWVIGQIKVAWGAFSNYFVDLFEGNMASIVKSLTMMVSEVKRQFAIAKGVATFSSSSHEIAEINKEKDQLDADTDKTLAEHRAKRAEEQEAREKAPGQEINTNETERNKNLKGIEDQRKGAQGILESDRQAEIATRRKAADEGLGKDKAALGAAQQEFQSLNAQAFNQRVGQATGMKPVSGPAILTVQEEEEAKGEKKKKDRSARGRNAQEALRQRGMANRKEREGLKGRDKRTRGMFDNEAEMPAVPTLGNGVSPEALDEAMKKAKVDVKGGFSAGALAGQGAGESIMSDQLKEQKSTNDNLKTINKTLVDSKPKFA